MATSPIIDTPFNVADKAAALRDAGIKTVVRYYNFRNSSVFPDKCLTAPEAEALTAAGLTVAVTFQQRQNQVGDFSKESGLSTGRRAQQLASETVGQPAGTGIYVSVDFDASEVEIETNIKPFFQGVREGMAPGGGKPAYRLGAYGSGLVCDTLRDAGLIELAWVSMSRGFRGTEATLAAGNWHLKQLAPPTKLLGFGVDFDEANPAKSDFGEFQVQAEDVHKDLAQAATPAVAPAAATSAMVAASAAAAKTMHVTARSGLRLRAGPGTNFDTVSLMPFGTQVQVQGTTDGWAKIDREGDGAVDGFAFAEFLA